MKDGYIKAVMESANATSPDLEEILQEWHTEDELSDSISDFLYSKVSQDGISEIVESYADKHSVTQKPAESVQLPKSTEGEDVTVRKYFDLSKFASLLHSGIWFSRVDLFDDDYEGKVSDETVRSRWNTYEYLEMEDDPPPFNLLDMNDTEDKIIQSQSYVSCWRCGGKESAIFWNAYIDGTNGVAIETSLENLQQLLEKAPQTVLIGGVNYREYKGSKDQFARDTISRIFHKRFAFADEQELRLLTRQKLNDFSVITDGKNFEVEIDAVPGFNVEIDARNLIDKVILPPKASDRVITQVAHLMEYNNIDAELWRSMLDVAPNSTAPVSVQGPNKGKVTQSDMRHRRIVNKSNYK